MNFTLIAQEYEKLVVDNMQYFGNRGNIETLFFEVVPKHEYFYNIFKLLKSTGLLQFTLGRKLGNLPHKAILNKEIMKAVNNYAKFNGVKNIIAITVENYYRQDDQHAFAMLSHYNLYGILHRLPSSKEEISALRTVSYYFKKIIVLAETAENILRSHGIANVITIDHPFISEGTVNDDKNTLKKKYKVPVDKITFSFVGECRREKGLQLFLEAITKLEAAVLDKIFINIAGKSADYNFRDNIENLFKSIGFKNYRLDLRNSDVNEDYKVLSDKEFAENIALTDYLILPYKYEHTGYSGPLVDAVHFNTPVIAADTPVIGRNVKDYDLGYIFEAESSDSLAKTIKMAINDRYSISDKFIGYVNKTTQAENRRKWLEMLYFDEVSDDNQAAKAIVPLILQYIQPKSIIHIGCGVGAWLAEFRLKGISDIRGIDNRCLSSELLQIPNECYIKHDLTDYASTVNRKYDLALSLEVAQCIEPQKADDYIKSLTRVSNVVIFSAAIPYQGGVNHINENWMEYWVALFQKYEFYPVDCFRSQLWTNQNVNWRFRQNLVMFVQKQEYLMHFRNIELNQIQSHSIVHPEMFLRICSKVKSNDVIRFEKDKQYYQSLLEGKRDKVISYGNLSENNLGHNLLVVKDCNLDLDDVYYLLEDSKKLTYAYTFIKQLKLVNTNTIVFFGTGSACAKICEYFPLSIAYFVDNSSSKWGTTFQGQIIFNPEKLLKENKHRLTIIIASQYYEEISQQLQEMGFQKEKHFWDGYKIYEQLV